MLDSLKNAWRNFTATTPISFQEYWNADFNSALGWQHGHTVVGRIAYPGYDEAARKYVDEVYKDIPEGTKLLMLSSNEHWRNGEFVSYDEEPLIEFTVPK